MRNSVSRQRGIGVMGALLMLAAVGFVIMVLVKLGPSYMTFLTVRSVMEDVKEDPNAFADRQGRGIIKALTRRLEVNDVRTVHRKDFKMTRQRDSMDLSVNYEVREHLAWNVDVVLIFEHQVNIPISGR